MTAPARSGLPGPLRRIRILAPLAQRNFRLLWYGLVVSLIGDGIFLVAVAWQAYAVDNHPSALAAVGLSASLPQLALLLVGGALSDRLSRRTVLVVSDLARGAALALAGRAGMDRAPQAVAAVRGGRGHRRRHRLRGPGLRRHRPRCWSARSICSRPTASTRSCGPSPCGSLGPALGGLLVAAAGASSAFAIDAATFAFSAWCLSRIDAIYRPPPNAARPPRCGPTSGRESSYVRRHTWLWGTFTAASLTYLLCLGPIQVLLPYVVKNELHGNAASLGLVLGTGGVGALAAAAIVGGRDHVRRPVTFMYVAWAGAALLVAGYGLATREWELAVAGLRSQRPGSRGSGGLVHPQTAPGPQGPPRTGFEHRLVRLDRPHAPVVRPDPAGDQPVGRAYHPRRRRHARAGADPGLSLPSRHARA